MAVLVSLQELRGSWMGYKGAAALEDTRNDPGEPGGPSERACLAEALQQPTSAVAGEPRRANSAEAAALFSLFPLWASRGFHHSHN